MTLHPTSTWSVLSSGLSTKLRRVFLSVSLSDGQGSFMTLQHGFLLTLMGLCETHNTEQEFFHLSCILSLLLALVNFLKPGGKIQKFYWISSPGCQKWKLLGGPGCSCQLLKLQRIPMCPCLPGCDGSKDSYLDSRGHENQRWIQKVEGWSRELRKANILQQ